MAVDAAAPAGQLSKPADEPVEPPEDRDGRGAAEAFSRRPALIAGLIAVLVLGALTGWLGFRAKESSDLQQQRATFLQVGRQGAINLTTLDYEHIDTDVQRILDSATGTFYDDFQQRAPSFTDVVRRVQSRSVGTVTEAALEEGDTPTQAEVLVAVSVTSTVVGQPETPPRAWRMRILVEKIDGDAKVSSVEFVP
ncbi:mammalian cell entry protein [Mycolicibacterium arenosum]|uniref:Mammalian cell entry protein n=1 Tax=Mycolicibacterium arenosum TaxID=2952157 RepID=A0ABT1LVW6_9MYCO|nr:mammalian cell entry protein [Mycolicibacterium sp. CAU 1645]MCP9271044.1 mammalian cell entry protein [Mycolicibacterium sp. CAU 1645]